MKKISFLIALLLIVSAIFGQTQSDLEFIEQTFENRGEIVLRFQHNGNRELVNELGRIMSIDKITDTYVVAYANRSEYEQFKTYGIEYEPVYEYYRRTRALNMATTVAQMANWDRYPTYAVYLEMMHNYATAHPTLCKMDTVGYSVNNRPIITMIISDNVGVDEDEPEFWWSSTMHGDETTGWYFMIRLVDELLTNYGTDEQITNLVNNVEIYISPLTNPDGTFYRSNDGTSLANSRRANANGTDLNRSFPDINGYAGTSDPEVTMMKNYADAHNFVMAANGHGGTECLNYPWDEQNWYSSSHPHPDIDWWQYICQQYANTCHALNSNYLRGPGTMADNTNNSTGITEGTDWYYTQGGRQDYMNYFHHCKELTMEWSDDKTLGTESLNTYWGYNRNAILDFTEQVLYGFRGIVTDACSNEPLSGVKVFINNHDADNSEVYSSAPIGNYHRPIYAGTYSVTFSKDGYIPQTITVTTQNQESVRLDVSLYPEDMVVPDFTASNTAIFEGSSVQFTNTTSGNYISSSWTFEGGNPATSTTANPNVTYNTHGTYDATLTIIDVNGCSISTTKQDYISVYEATAPVADFVASETYVTIGSPVSFTDQSANIPTSWSWTFEGGSPATSTEQNPTVTYDEPGEYTVTLVASNAYGSSTETKTAYIEVVASVTMSNETLYVCGGTYKDPGGDGDYGNNANYTQTIYPSTDGAMIRLTFTSFSLQAASSSGWGGTTTCNDKLYIYDGTSTSATVLVDGVCGTSNPGTITATNAAGALTIVFTSNNRTVSSGWEAEISCYMPSPEIEVQNYTPTIARYSTTGDLSVTFANTGAGTTSANTTATLSTSDEYITLNTTTTTIGALARNATAVGTFNFSVAEDVPDGHVATINVEIADGSSIWNSTLTITAIGHSCEAPTGMDVALNDTDATITWDTQTTTTITISDDFEDHTYGTINSAGTIGWTYIDGDNASTGTFSTIEFTNESSKMAFIVLDGSQITGQAANVTAHSGNNFIGAPYANNVQNNDWIVSPELNFTDDFTFSFYARSYSNSYSESFYAAYSTTGNDADDFTNLNSTVATTTSTWREYSYQVPANAKYVAIHCVSNDRFIFCVDDITISGSATTGTAAVNIYDNGTLVASNVTGGTYTATNLSAGEHCLSIRAVCDDDSESLAAQNCITVGNPLPRYDVTINAANGGSISPNGTQSVSEGNNFTFHVTPDECYEIGTVTVNGSAVTLDENNAYTIQNVTAEQTINATFNQISYSITASTGNGGTIDADNSVYCGENFTFTVTPDACYEIGNVTVNGTTITLNANNQYTINNVTANQTVNVTFAPISYTIAATAGNGGSISPAGNTSVTCGGNQTFAIAANNGYRIVDVTVDGQSQGAIESYTFSNVTADHTITATFIAVLNINIDADAEGGSVSPTGTQTLDAGESFTFTVTPEPCYEIGSVTVNGTAVTLNANNQYTITNITADQNINVTFNQLTYTIAATAGNGGSITPAGNTTVNCGESQTYTIAAADGYMIDDVTVDGQSVGAVASYTFSNVTEGHSINATFSLIPPDEVVIVVNAEGDGGTVTPNGSTTITEGEDFTFYVTPDNCHTVGTVTVNGTEVALDANNSYTIHNVTTEQNVNVTFSLITYTITATAGNGGSITPAGNTTVNCGENQTYTIAAADGYTIEDVLVDGQSVGAVTSYTFSNVTEGHSINATFSEIIVIPECFAVTDLTARVEAYGIVLSWNAAENAISYEIYRNGVRIATETNTSTIDMQGHEGDTYYIITNCANGGTSEVSETATAAAEPSCNAITDLVARVEAYGIVLSWNAAENATSYDIFCNGNWISTTSGTSYIDMQGHEGDTYYIITNCANGGTSDASDTAVATITAITDAETNISVYPNPASDMVLISADENITRIEIVSITGQILHTEEVNSDRIECNIENITAGTYIIRVFGNTNVYLKKLIVK